MKVFVVLWLVLTAEVASAGDKIRLSLCVEQTKGSYCNLTCDTAADKGNVAFYKDNVIRAACPKRYPSGAQHSCLSSDDAYKAFSDFHDNITVLVIRSLDVRRDSGAWYCSMNEEMSERQPLFVTDLPQSAVTSSLSRFGGSNKVVLRESASTEIDVHFGCVYPHPIVKVVTDDPSCILCDKEIVAESQGTTYCENNTYGAQNYLVSCPLSGSVLASQESCVCKQRKLYASVRFYKRWMSVDLTRELNLLNKTECGKLTGFSWIEVVPLLSLLISTIVLVTILCLTSSHYLVKQVTEADMSELQVIEDTR